MGLSDSVSVDMSNTYLEWARDNFALNKLDPRLHRVVRDDCFRWLETANAQFDLIFMGPADVLELEENARYPRCAA